MIFAVRFWEKYRVILREKWYEKSENTILGSDDVVNGFEGSGWVLLCTFTDLRETSCLDELSVLEDTDTIRDGFSDWKRMRDKKHRTALFGESSEDILGDERAFGVETDDGFIDEKEFRFVEQGGENTEFLFVSA